MYLSHYVLFISKKELFILEILTLYNNSYSQAVFGHRQSISYASQLLLKKGFPSLFHAMKQEPWNHETAQINLNGQRIVYGNDKDRLTADIVF